MSDHIEKHIKQNKDEFQFELPNGHMERFKKKLSPDTEEEKPSPTLIPNWLKVAAGILITIGLFSAIFYAGRLSKSNPLVHEEELKEETLPLKSISNEMKEVELFFQQKINEKKQIASLAISDDLELQSFFNQIEDLEKQYQILCKELAWNNGDERIVQSMIKNYQLRLSLLEKLLEEIQLKKKIKSQRHENKHA